MRIAVSTTPETRDATLRHYSSFKYAYAHEKHDEIPYSGPILCIRAEG